MLWWPRGVGWGWDERKILEGGDVYKHIADSLHCTAETNTILQNEYANKKFFEEIMSWAGKAIPSPRVWTKGICVVEKRGTTLGSCKGLLIAFCVPALELASCILLQSHHPLCSMQVGITIPISWSWRVICRRSHGWFLGELEFDSDSTFGNHQGPLRGKHSICWFGEVLQK